jgi:hypothetical protein
MMENKTLRGIVFLMMFAALAYVALQIPVFSLQGEAGKSFTLFEFFGPIAGAFIGIGGVAAIGIAKLLNAFITGSPLTLMDLAKLTPMMFAAYYFWKSSSRGASDRLGIIVPAAAMLAFWLHPVGQQAWAYALYWAIPIIAKFLPERLMLRSLGATLSAHAVGSVLFLYTIETAPALWFALIPVVAVERGLFALGISASHIVFTNAMEAIDRAAGIARDVNVEKRYVLF